MIDSQLLEFIVCPDNRNDLSVAPDEVLAKVNKLIAGDRLYFVSGDLIENHLDQLLIRADGQIGYGVFQGIPNLLVHEGIPLSKLDI